MTIQFDSGVRAKRDDESLVEYYIDLRKNELAPGTKKNYRAAWKALKQHVERNEYEIGEMTKKEALNWCDDLRRRDMQQNVAEMYVSTVGKVISYLKQTPEVKGGNPFREALNTDPFSYDDTTTKLEVDIESLRRAIGDIRSPVTLYIFVMLLKTGLRRSEFINLDERDLNINRPISKTLDSPRSEIRNKPNTIYVDSSVCEGEATNGEVRGGGNKPESYRHIPLDEETIDLIEWYLSLVPRSPSPANPLLRTIGTGGYGLGQRVGKNGVYKRIKSVARDNNWDVKNGVTPHWCRHWFTTQLRARISNEEVPIGSSKEYVQGLRGDTEEGVISTYTQDWSIDQDSAAKEYPEVLRDNIPNLFIDTNEKNGSPD